MQDTLKALKTDNVQSRINGLKSRGLAPKTIRNAYNNLNTAIKKAVVLRMIPYNPCGGVELPKIKKYQANVYTATQVNNLPAVAANTDLYPAIAIATSTGVRRGELAALKWDHVDLANKVIHIRENMVKAGTEIPEKSPKSDAGRRDISIGSDVAALLQPEKAIRGMGRKMMPLR